MKKFDVVFERSQIRVVPVEAETEDEAEARAWIEVEHNPGEGWELSELAEIIDVVEVTRDVGPG